MVVCEGALQCPRCHEAARPAVYELTHRAIYFISLYFSPCVVQNGDRYASEAKSVGSSSTDMLFGCVADAFGDAAKLRVGAAVLVHA